MLWKTNLNACTTSHSVPQGRTMPLAWKKNTHDCPSEYSIDINGRPLTCFLCRMEEAQSTATYNYIRTKFAKEVHAVGVAKGDKQEGECACGKERPRSTKYSTKTMKTEWKCNVCRATQ